MIHTVLLIAAGSAAGGVARFLLGSVIQRTIGGEFPLGTLVVNALGCLSIGALAAVLTAPTHPRDNAWAMLVIGFLGGFTTFSAFGLETFRLIATGRTGLAALNVAASCGLGVAAVWLGHWLGELCATRS